MSMYGTYFSSEDFSSRKFQDCPQSKQNIKYLLSHLHLSLESPIQVTQLDHSNIPYEYKVNRYGCQFQTADEWSEFLAKMSMSYSISYIKTLPVGEIGLYFIETTFGSNIDADVIQMFVDTHKKNGKALTDEEVIAHLNELLEGL